MEREEKQKLNDLIKENVAIIANPVPMQPTIGLPRQLSN